MARSDLLETAHGAVALAVKKGAKEAAASAYRSRDVELGWRDGKVEKVSEATTRGVSLALYVDGRFSAMSTSDLREGALDRFVEDAVALARTLAVDPHRSLPDPKHYEGRSKVDLELVDPAHAELTAEHRRRLARELEEAARSVTGADAILSVTTNVSDTHARSARVTSNGFEGERVETTFALSADVSCRDADGRRPEDWDSAVTRHAKALPSTNEVGRRAAERALATRGSKKIESGAMTLVVDARAAGRLVRSLFGALTGRALQQRQSFLDGELGKRIGSKLLTLSDDPHVPRGLGSRLYDGDGFATKKRAIFDAGVFRSFYIDDYYGRKLRTPATTGGPSNVLFATGKKNPDELLRDVREAILVTSFLGGNSNATTGDYSFGIQGFRVRGGQRAEPIAEMNISGNQRELWKKLAAVGNDPYPYSSLRAPTLVFDAVQVAGL